ncbi:MAG: C10 family peptidase [Treponema sp.]|jgi:hypothetical protein|nr:C10 family peptidase [Treponema sp.]
MDFQFPRKPERFSRSGERPAGPGAAEGPVEIYEFSLGGAETGDEGFVLASNDDRIGNILAIAEGSLEKADEDFTAFLQGKLQDYVDSTIAEYNSIDEAAIAAALEKALEKALAQEEEGSRALATHWSGVNLGSEWQAVKFWTDITIRKSPLLSTRWGQGERYTDLYAYNNYIKYKDGPYTAGCGPTAMAQIAAYHNYIKPVANFKPAAFDIPSVGKWAGNYNFSAIRNMPAITKASPHEAKGQVAVLMYQLGKLAGATYNKNGVASVYIHDAYSAFKTIGYIIEEVAQVTWLTETATSSTITYENNSPAIIKTALNNNRPLYASGYSNEDMRGHAWVIDGYGDITWYNECLRNSQTGQLVNVLIKFNNCLMVHCNMGWDGGSNGWYVFGIFDTNNRTIIEPNSHWGGGNYSTNTWVIDPKKP